ncbi:hypothetical protein [Deinococcus aetherius]|uniref:hypothetical protein n=1 Tax=Deinococcus aetherius TaxID=200252 RepID=UPI0022306390|nr:hypothetical protein [Deinococcus aetherius]
MHLLGHVHATRGGEPLSLPGKAAALLTYLTLEECPHHREHLAGLLWDTPDALRNLRVELSRLRGRGLAPFPARQPMLALRCETDLDRWLRGPEPLNERDLAAWLSPLRGPALSGLEDLGSAAFRDWVDRRRSLIHDRIEERLGSVCARFEGRGQPQAGGQVRACAERLGLHLPARSLPPAAPDDLTFEWPEQVRALRGVFERAARAPQLVLLRGHVGTRRTLLEDAVQGTPWRAVQVRFSSQRLLLQAALAGHLRRALPPERRPPGGPPGGTTDPDADLIDLAGRMTEAGVPLLVALHDVNEVPAWLAALLRFMLDLPLPLVVVLSASPTPGSDHLRLALGPLGGRRLHHVTMPPLSVAGVMRALAREGPDHGGAGRARAARLVQRSEGCPLYVQALVRSGGDLAAHDGRLPPDVRDRALADLAHLPGPAREGLARLAQLHDRFDRVMAGELLGEAAPGVLNAACRSGLLVPAGREEALTLPGLEYRSDDAETGLAFASEVTRAALAGTLPAAERHALRRTLARLLLPTQPALSLLYATRANLPELAAEARAALPAPPPAGFRGGCAEPAPEPSPHPHPRRGVLTPNGYRVALDGGFLEVLRRGRLGPPPLLTLLLPDVPAGTWALTARLDVTGSAAPPGLLPPPFALGLRVGTGPRVVYAPAPLPDHHAGGAGHTFGAVLPLNCWFRLNVTTRGGPLELSVREVNVALTVGDLTPVGRGASPRAVWPPGRCLPPEDAFEPPLPLTPF